MNICGYNPLCQMAVSIWGAGNVFDQYCNLSNCKHDWDHSQAVKLLSDTTCQYIKPHQEQYNHSAFDVCGIQIQYQSHRGLA